MDVGCFTKADFVDKCDLQARTVNTSQVVMQPFPEYNLCDYLTYFRAPCEGPQPSSSVAYLSGFGGDALSKFLQARRPEQSEVDRGYN